MAEKKEKTNSDPVRPSTHDDLLVVGIGASAGGVHALQTFFKNVRADSGNVYVVILHLSPEYESQLAEVLQSSAPIPVEQVHDRRTTVEPNRVYVIPPNRGLEIRDGYLATTNVVDSEVRRAPVDLFFRTLAESHGSNAVSVVLTGTGPNGSMGIKRIKEKGGVVFVQDPQEAEYSDMPRNSIDTGLVDLVLPLSEIPRKIDEYKARRRKTSIAGAETVEQETEEQALISVFALLRTQTGHDFSNYKRATVLRRIERRMSVREKNTLSEYLAYIRENPDEARALLKDLLISVTNFFRDHEAFEKLRLAIIPKLFGNKSSKEQVRIWVAGCASGEEAYSIAMLCAEHCENRLDAPLVQIFATDIDESAIDQARSGLYSESDVADVSHERLQHFFHQEGPNYRIRREIRETVLFAVHNVMKDPPFSRVDLISCRNLLIYLNRDAQDRVMRTFHFALNPGGYLFVGTSETADGDSDLFVPANKEFRIYQSRPVDARILAPIPEVPVATPQPRLRLTADDIRGTEQKALERLSYTALHQRLLEMYAPPSVVVNTDHDIVHLSERAGRYLQITGGELSTNLLHVVRPELRLELRSALYQATQRNTTVSVPALRVKTDHGLENVNLIVRPVTQPEDPNRGFTLVIFEPATEVAAELPESLISDEPVARRLEEELVQTKSQLRATIEQYEIQHEELKASNEELQAINEELRSAVEEIETSKEELQSVNEELSTVNQELKIKIDELSHSNNNLQNLINSTAIGTIFLDRRLRVMLFTQPATEIFSLIPADIGRPLSDLQSKLRIKDIAETARKVLADLQPIEFEIEAEAGRSYMMRALPYRTADDRIEGIVITFIDITSRLKQEKELRESRDRINEVIDSIGDAFYAVDANWNFIFVNRTLYEWTERQPGTLIGKNVWKEFPQAVGSQSYLMQQKAMKERKVLRFETDLPVKGRWLDVSVYPDKRGGLSSYFRDVTERRRTDVESRVREEQLRLIFESVSDYAIFTVDGRGRVTSWNNGAEKTFGYSDDEMMGQSADILFTDEDRRRGEPDHEMKTALEKGRSEDERWHLRKDGTRFYASGVMQPLRSDGAAGFVKICRDMTDKLAAEDVRRDRSMLQRLVTTQEDERKRIARDLHDTLGQQLTALRLKLEAVKSNYGAEPAMIKAIDETQLMAKKIDDDISFLTWELRPTALNNLGLRNALANYVAEWSKNFNIPAEFHTAKLARTRLVPEIEVNLYRIAQEALNNVVKHAKAKKVSVLLEFNRGEAVLVVEDDGRGFNPNARTRRTDSGMGLGLIGMRERAALFGGKLEIESARGKGTTVIARVPDLSSTNEQEGGKTRRDKTRTNSSTV